MAYFSEHGKNTQYVHSPGIQTIEINEYNLQNFIKYMCYEVICNDDRINEP